MKTLYHISIMALAIVSQVLFLSCSSDRTTVQDEPAGDNDTTKGMTLVVNFSLPTPYDIDGITGASYLTINGAIVGENEYVADEIASYIGCKRFSITVEDGYYPDTYQALADFANQERADGIHPELTSHIEDFADYDTVFVGYPIWWGDMPMPLYSFFDEYDFSGKTIIPFSTHAGSGLAGTVSTIRSLEPEAVVMDGFTIRGATAPQNRDEIIDWLENLGF